MDTIIFQNESLPVQVELENVALREMHSEILHLHDNVEIIVINSGTVICSAGENNFELRAGDVCLINHKQMHRICANGEARCAYKVLNVGVSLLMQNPLIYQKYLKPMIEDNSFSHISFDGNSGAAAKIAELITDIEKLQHTLPSGYELRLIALLHLLFHEIYLTYINEPKKPPMDNNAFIQKKMIEFIYNHFNEEIILDDIARAGNVSRSQCAKIFNKYAQLSPINFLNKHRLEISLHLLRSTTNSVSEIAQSCGFFDQSYFNRLFLREYGCTPLSYRKSGWKSPSIS